MAAHQIAVINYHKGNLSSVARSVSAVGGNVIVSDDPEVIGNAGGIILPGVGSFEDAMSYMRAQPGHPVPRHLPRPAAAV